MKNFQKGVNAEAFAESILKQKNLYIIDKRIKSIYGEIDILAKYKNDYYIFEVKYRKDLKKSAYSINKQQVERSLKTFFIYCSKNNINYDNIYFCAFLSSPNNYKIITLKDINFETNSFIQ